ncbi:MAG: prephenate dehydrogenase/arogenate dehydrogenase family protein [Methylococcaceae bacterium]|nr:prephenate dehydrogenase/arogenate dehydrogenase family protein [Methylococcaceae bacterium]
MFKKLCVIGVGLIGGSIARAARKANPTIQIIGFGRAEDGVNLALAKASGVLDDYTLDIASAVVAADAVVIATPVGAYCSVLQALKPHWSQQVYYTDAGSTKGSVVEACLAVFGYVPENFIPAHPIAGAEASGVAAARADLFEQKCVILTPMSNAEAGALLNVQQFWEALGATVTVMSTEQHDAILAATSHLPHILAFALVNLLGRKDEQDEIFKYAAGGFKDFTRIASSDPTMWLDICMANKQQLIPLLDQLKTELNNIQQFLVSGDNQQLFETFQYAKNARQRFLNQFENL